MYLDQPIKGLLGQFVAFGMFGDIVPDARPDALEFFQSGGHLG